MSVSNTNKTCEQALYDAAKQAQQHAYAPYSNFKVGAAVLSKSKAIFAGCNVENAAYPLGQCAEAGAISTMIASGETQISEIAILSPNADFCPPCGGCRQKISEFSSKDTRVHMYSSEGKHKSLLISELLPLAFDLDAN